MAKTASIKHNPLSNPRSRASKRQTFPSIDTDKSLKTISPPPVSSVLAPRPNAGVSKRKSKVQKSSKQKQRDARRQDRAEVVMERMEVKLDQKIKKVKHIKERKSEWGIVNGEGKEERRKAILGGAKIGDQDDEWQDVKDGEEVGEMEEVMENGTMAPPAAPVQVESTETNGVADVETVEEEDKIT